MDMIGALATDVGEGDRDLTRVLRSRASTLSDSEPSSSSEDDADSDREPSKPSGDKGEFT